MGFGKSYFIGKMDNDLSTEKLLTFGIFLFLETHLFSRMYVLKKTVKSYVYKILF